MNEQYKYDVKTICELLSISRTTLYKRLIKFENQLNGHIAMNKGIRYFDDIALEILKDDTINVNTNTNTVNTNDSALYDVLSNTIALLSQQLQEKDRQIEDLTSIIKSNQVLLKQNSETKLIESSTKKSFWHMFRKEES